MSSARCAMVILSRLLVGFERFLEHAPARCHRFCRRRRGGIRCNATKGLTIQTKNNHIGVSDGWRRVLRGRGPRNARRSTAGGDDCRTDPDAGEGGNSSFRSGDRPTDGGRSRGGDTTTIADRRDRQFDTRRDAEAFARRRAARTRSRAASAFASVRLKFLLPVAAVAMAGGFVAYSYPVAPSGGGERRGRATAFADGKLVMANPKLEGFTKDNRPYSMTAMRAVQDVDQEGVVKLEGIDAKLPVDAENWATSTPRTASTTASRTRSTSTATSTVDHHRRHGRPSCNRPSRHRRRATLKTAEPVDIKLNGTQITADSMTIAGKRQGC